MAKDLRYWMGEALALAENSARAGEVPVGAIIINADNEIIAAAENRMQRDADPLAHAEMLAIHAACNAVQKQRLNEYSLFVTMEPCAMCAMAMAHVRIGRLVFGAYDVKSGGVENGARIFTHAQTHHKPTIIGGVSEEACQKLLQDFFKNLR